MIIRDLKMWRSLREWYQGIGQDVLNGDGHIEIRIRRLEMVVSQLASDRLDVIEEKITDMELAARAESKGEKADD